MRITKLKKTKEDLPDKYGSLYNLLTKIIFRASDDKVSLISIGLPTTDLEDDFEDTLIPVYFKLENQWKRVFTIPIDLHIDFLNMIEKLSNQKADEIFETTDEFVYPNNKFDVYYENINFECVYRFNKLYNYEIEINCKS